MSTTTVCCMVRGALQKRVFWSCTKKTFILGSLNICCSSLSLSGLTHAIPCRLYGAWWARIKKVPASAFLLYFIFLWQKDVDTCDGSKTTHESLSTWRQEEGHSWNSRDVLCIPGTIKSQTHSIILDNRHMLNTCTAVQVNIWKWH